MKRTFLTVMAVSAAAVAFVSCSDNKGGDPTPKYEVISFEESEKMVDFQGQPVALTTVDVYTNGSVAYSCEQVFWPKSYATEVDEYDQKYWQGPYFQTQSGSALFGGYYDDGTLWDYSETGAVTDVWGGFVLSQRTNTTATTANQSNQFDVWASGGARGTKTFAVGFDSNTAGEGYMQPKEYNAPQIDFATAVKPVRLYLANSAYTYAYFTGQATDSYAVQITGWLNGAEVKSVTCTLVDGATRVEDWVEVDLSEMGSVDKLTFKSLITPKTYTPCYFCMDELTIEK